MNIPMQTESLHVVDRQSYGSPSDQTFKLSHYDKVIENKFHIINGISKLLSTGDNLAPSGYDEFDVPDQPVQPKAPKTLSCKLKKKIRKER
jgi:hypothetical protein